MIHFTLLEKADLIKMFYENMLSIIRTKRAFRKNYPTKNCSIVKTFRDLAKKFENTDSIANSVYRCKIRAIRTIKKSQALMRM